MKYNITIVVTIHSEGRILHRTFKALRRSVDYVRAKGINVEIMCILDRCTDTITRNIVDCWHQRLKENILVMDVDYGAVADTRNFGISQASGEYIALLDGDDLYGEKFIFKAYQTCLKDKNVIAHPEAEYLFPVEPFLRIYTTEKEAFLDLIYNNIFTSRTMAHKDIYLNVPSIRNTDIWAFQDWLWHCDAAAGGYQHKVAPGTIIAVRQKPFAKSLWQNNFFLNRVIRPNKLFRKIFLRELDADSALNQPEAKLTIKFLERSIITFLDKCYTKNPVAYRLIMNSKRKIWSLYNKLFKKSLKPWMVEELDRLSEIDPELSAIKNPNVRYTATHRRFYKVITDEMSQLIKTHKPVIYLAQDLNAESLAKCALTNEHPTMSHIFLITTNSFPNRLKNNLPKHYLHIDIGNTNLIFEERLNLLHRLLLESHPAYIHVCGSHVALEMFSRYGKTFNNIKVQVSLSDPKDDRKMIPNKTGLSWELRKYPDLIDFFDHIITDSIDYKEKLVDIFGIDRNLISIYSNKCPGIHG